MSPTQRTLAHMRQLGYLAVVVERWNPFAKIRQDLFGFVDVLCIRKGETVAVQCCNATDIAKRVQKIADHANTPAVRAAGWRISVQGWRKNAAGRYVLREVDCS